MDAKTALTLLQHKAMLMESIHADFNEKTWTFRGPWFECGAGDYLIVSSRDWKDIVEQVDADERSSVGKTEGNK